MNNKQLNSIVNGEFKIRVYREYPSSFLKSSLHK